MPDHAATAPLGATPRASTPSALTRLAVELAGPALLAGLLAVVAQVLGLHGTDQAMQIFMVDQVRAHGLAIVDTAWYGGVYPMAYSAAFPLIAAVIGLAASATVASLLAAFAFDRLTVGYFGRRTLGSWYFAASTLVQVAVGELPFLFGEAFGLAALLALTRQRRTLAVALGVMAALCSPLAAAFLALVCLAWWAHSLPGDGLPAADRVRAMLAAAKRLGGAKRLARRSWPLALAAAAMGVVLVLAVAFPGTGPFPFTWTELVVVEALCAAALSPLVRTTPGVRMAVAIYGAAALVSFVVPNPLGGNAGRLASAVGVPLLACFVSARGPAVARLSIPRRAALAHRVADLERRWRPYAAAVVLPFAVWQWAPGLSAVRSAHNAPSSTAAFYAPLVQRLADVDPAKSRIEVVPTVDHWEAAYIGRSALSLARGWERQIDTARNPIFYTDDLLTADSYRAWLAANGVSWVALPIVPDAQIDYAGRAERSLLVAGVPGLTRVWHSSSWQLWQVDDSPGLVSGPAALQSVTADQVSLSATAGGDVVLRLHYTPYWSLTPATAGCVEATPDGYTELSLVGPGPVTLHAAVAPGRGPVCAP